MTKYLPLILFALFVDGLQAVLSFAFFTLGMALTAATPLGAAAAGCGGAYAASSNAASGAINCAEGAVAGAGLSFVGAPLGMVMGMASDVCVSLTFGLMLLLTLSLCGLFYPSKLFGGGLFEILPGLSVLPGWTLMTVLCILQKRKEAGALAGSTAGALTQTLSSKTLVGRMYGGIKSLEQKNSANMQSTGVVSNSRIRTQRVLDRQHVKQELRSIDGVKPKGVQAMRSKTNYAL